MYIYHKSHLYGNSSNQISHTDSIFSVNTFWIPYSETRVVDTDAVMGRQHKNISSNSRNWGCWLQNVFDLITIRMINCFLVWTMYWIATLTKYEEILGQFSAFQDRLWSVRTVIGGYKNIQHYESLVRWRSGIQGKVHSPIQQRIWLNDLESLAFAKLRRVTFSFVMSVCPSDLWNVIDDFSESCYIFIEIRKELKLLYMETYVHLQ